MSYRLKLAVIMVLVIAVSFGLGGGALITASFEASLEEQINAALDDHENLRERIWLICSIAGADSRSLSQLELGRMQGLSIRGADGTVLLDIAPDCLHTAALPAPEQGQCVYLQQEDAFGHGLLIRSTLSWEDNTFDILARYDLSSCYAARRIQTGLFHKVYAVVIGTGILTALIISWSMTRKLKRISHTARAIQQGDLTARSGVGGQDEFGLLSQNFDAMAESLQSSINRIQSEMARQEAFMGAFAHELKTPMTAIIGYGDLLRRDNLREETRLMAAEYIVSEGKRLERLSHKLLELLLLQNEAVQMTEQSLPDLIADVRAMIMPLMEERGIVFHCRCDSGTVCLEPDLIRALLYNLLDNAMKAIDADGIITLSGECADWVCRFVVSDNGRGMASKDLGNITEAFYRADKARSRKQGGAGLGLTLCREIVRMHHGDLRFSSIPGQGTTVTVTIPARRDVV